MGMESLMRKDMRLGLGIGGVVLAVLVVMVIVVPDRPGTTNGPAASQQGLAAQTSSGDSAAPKPAQAIDAVAGRQQTVSTKQATPIAGAGSGAAARDLASANPMRDGSGAGATDSSAAHASSDWNRLLAFGLSAPPAVSSAPDRSDRSATAAQVRPVAQVTITPVGPASLADDDQAASRDTAAPAHPLLAPDLARSSSSSLSSSVSAPQVTPSAAPGMQQYRIKSGETYTTIAAALYGSANYYPHIQRANPNVDPHRLRPGMVINVPPREQVLGQSTAHGQATDGSAGGSEVRSRVATGHEAGAAPARIDSARQYRVQSGESLYRISMKLYGDGRHVDAIYQRNKQQIGADPARLKLGMILELPEPPTATQQDR